MSLADQQVACEAENPQLRVPDGPIASGEGIGTQGEPERCAICGWPLVSVNGAGCWKGSCSLRPLPEVLYDRARAIRDGYLPEDYVNAHYPPAQPSPVVQAPELSLGFINTLDGAFNPATGEFAPYDGSEMPPTPVAPVVPVEETKRDAGEATLSWRHGQHDFTITTTSAYLCEKLDEIAAEAFAKFAALPATEKEN